MKSKFYVLLNAGLSARIRHRQVIGGSRRGLPVICRSAIVFFLSCWIMFAGACTPPFSFPVQNAYLSTADQGYIPGLPTYAADLQTAMNGIYRQIAGLPQPPIVLRGQAVLTTANRLGSSDSNSTNPETCVAGKVNYPGSGLSSVPGAAGVCHYDNYVVQDAYVDALQRAGVQVVDINLGITPLGSSPEYAAAWTANGYTGTPELPNDCLTSGALAFRATPQPGDGFYCQTLAVLDEMIWHAHLDGMTVRLAPSPAEETGLIGDWANNGSAYVNGNGCNFSASSTESSLEACYTPAFAAAAARWGAFLTGFTPLHEPSGIWGAQLGRYPVPLTVSDVHTFLQNSAIAIKAAHVPAVRVGADVGTLSKNSVEAAFWNDWTTGLSGSLDFYAIDLYPNTADTALYAAQGGQWLCQSAITLQALNNQGASSGRNPSDICLNNTAASGNLFASPVKSDGSGLLPCSPSQTDYNSDCQWTVTSDLNEGAGLLSAQYKSGGTFSGNFSGSGWVPISFTADSAGNGRNAVGCVLVTNGVAGTIVVTNIGNGYTWGGSGPTGFRYDIASPSTYAIPDGNTCGGTALTMTNTAVVKSAQLTNSTTGGVLNLFQNWMSQLPAAKPLEINESNRPIYTRYNCAPTGSRSIFDNNYIGFENATLDAEFYNAIIPWAAAQGVRSISMYASQTLLWYDTTDIQSSSFAGFNGAMPCSGVNVSQCGTDTWWRLLQHLSETSVTGQDYNSLAGTLGGK